MINYILGLIAITAITLTAQSALAEPAAAAASNGMNIWQLVWDAGYVVKFVLFLLGLFSVISWAVIISKFLVIRRATKQNLFFQEVFWNAKSLSAANTQAAHLSGSPLASVFNLAYGELQKILGLRRNKNDNLPTALMANVKRALSRGQAEESTKLARTVTFLATTANTAPFIGLFGTVWGIMDAFRNIGVMKTANLSTVAPGIAEALVATAFGLLAAIPAVVFYNHFNRRIQVIESQMDTFSQDFLNLVELEVMSRQSQPEDPGQAAV